MLVFHGPRRDGAPRDEWAINVQHCRSGVIDYETRSGAVERKAMQPDPLIIKSPEIILKVLFRHDNVLKGAIRLRIGGVADSNGGEMYMIEMLAGQCLHRQI